MFQVGGGIYLVQLFGDGLFIRSCKEDVKTMNHTPTAGPYTLAMTNRWSADGETHLPCVKSTYITANGGEPIALFVGPESGANQRAYMKLIELARLIDTLFVDIQGISESGIEEFANILEDLSGIL